jgi:O-acetylserine/cysteine efflux transporter
MFIWGTNFVVTEIGLRHLPPLLLATGRFVLSAIPAIFFVKRPDVPLRIVAPFGVLLGAQFGFLFVGMRSGITPGLASLAIQMQVFFTVGIAALALRQPIAPNQLIALGVAGVGLLIIGIVGGSAATPLAIGLVMAAAFSWAACNLIATRLRGVNMLAFMVWASPFAAASLGTITLIVEGPSTIGSALRNAMASPTTWAVVAWLAYANTLLGYGIWNELLSRYDVGKVAPIGLLVPVFGMLGSAIALGEPLPGWKITAALLVVGGLALNQVPAHRGEKSSRH